MANPWTVLEAKIDDSLSDYLEERALAIALEKASCDQERDRIQQLAELRQHLLVRRAAHTREMIAKRHARGEFYSPAKVKSINAFGPSRAELDKTVRDCYLQRPNSGEVLKAHARIHFGYNLMAQRSQLAYATADVKSDMQRMYREEAHFAEAWLEAIDDHPFRLQIREQQRQALRSLRSCKTAMFLVTRPPHPELGQLDCQALGKAWTRLDDLCLSEGLVPLSAYIGFEDQSPADDFAAAEVLASVSGLAALLGSQAKIPGKKAVRASLEQLQRILEWLQEHQGRLHFEVDL